MRASLRFLLVLAAALAVAGCGSDAQDGAAGTETAVETAAGSELPRGSVVIAPGDGQVSLEVEIAETVAHRQQGLMGRVSLPRQAGMVFLFEEETQGGFWMKNTLIPLSIAFFDERGAILRILDMEPCRADPCPVYDPGTPYHGALEVNKGMFRTWGVERGDVITVERGSS